MTIAPPILCDACAHLDLTARGTCAAYPRGIPLQIGAFGADHHEPRPGDHGLQFKLADRPGAAEALKDWTRTFGSAQ